MKKCILFLLLSLFLLLPACASEPSDLTYVYTFTDSLEREVHLTSYEKTAVVSGSLAEIWSIAGGELYGVTNDAYDEAHSLELSDDVKNYGDVKNPSIERIIADGVDFVILSSTIAGHLKLEHTLEAAGITAAYFDVEHFADYLKMLKICTDITDRSDLYTEKGEAIGAKIDAARSLAEGQPSPSILLLRAYSTGIKAKGGDNMTGGMLADLGTVNIADSETSLLEELSLEAIVRADPAFIFITTMGDEEAALARYEADLASNPAWQSLTAVKNGNVHILPKDLYHYKPNDRWDEAYEHLAEILYETE